MISFALPASLQIPMPALDAGGEPAFVRRYVDGKARASAVRPA